MQGEILKEGKDKKSVKVRKTASKNKSNYTKRKEIKQKTFLKLLSGGCSKAKAREILNVSREAYDKWRQRDEGFAELESQAEAECIIKAVSIIGKSVRKDPKWAAWLLERVCPECYAPIQHRPKEQQQQPSQSPLEALTALIKANMGKMTEEDRQAFERIIKLLPPEEAS